jgi:hypothetical protein
MAGCESCAPRLSFCFGYLSELAVRDAHGEVPHVPDETILEVLRRLWTLDEERLSYRARNVGQIGSVYGQ